MSPKPEIPENHSSNPTNEVITTSPASTQTKEPVIAISTSCTASTFTITRSTPSYMHVSHFGTEKERRTCAFKMTGSTNCENAFKLKGGKTAKRAKPTNAKLCILTFSDIENGLSFMDRSVPSSWTESLSELTSDKLSVRFVNNSLCCLLMICRCIHYFIYYKLSYSSPIFYFCCLALFCNV